MIVSWEILSPAGAVGPTLYRLRVPGGWLLSSGVFVADALGLWAGDPLVAPTPVPTPMPAPTPTPAPAPKRWLGQNIYNSTDWSTDYLFRDFMMRARQWHSAPLNGWSDGRTLVLDASRNVLSLAPDQNAKSVLFTAPRPSVNFVFTWTGTGTFAFDGGTVVSSAPNRIVFRPAATGNVVLTMLTCSQADPPRGLSLVMESQVALTSTFNPDFVLRARDYGCLRFMDLANTNVIRSAASLARDLEPLAKAPMMLTNSDDALPVEVLVELANVCGTDGWFCIPMNASDAYVDAYLARIASKLAPGLKAYVETSNEHWNTIFPWYAATPGTGAGTTHDQKMRTYALRAADIAAKVKAVLGGRGVSVLGAQSPALVWQQELVNMIRAAGKTVPDVIATAPYFGHSLPDDPAIFTDGRAAAAVDKAIAEVVASKAQANRNGMRLVCYEMGQHVIPGTVVNRDPRMEAVYANYLARLKAALGGELACHYVLNALPSGAGSWGASEGTYAAEGPKAKALKASL